MSAGTDTRQDGQPDDQAMGESLAQGSSAAMPEEPAKHRRGVLGSIIRTTKATSTRIKHLDVAMAAQKCRNCGGARAEVTDLRVCQFCGDRFMTDEASSGIDSDALASED